MVSIYALGSISGGHFNPAVTVTLYLAKVEKDTKKIGLYIAAQLSGGIAAGLVYCCVFFGETVPLGPKTNADKELFGIASVAGVEILYTFVRPGCGLNGTSFYLCHP